MAAPYRPSRGPCPARALDPSQRRRRGRARPTSSAVVAVAATGTATKARPPRHDLSLSLPPPPPSPHPALPSPAFRPHPRRQCSPVAARPWRHFGQRTSACARHDAPVTASKGVRLTPPPAFLGGCSQQRPPTLGRHGNAWPPAKPEKRHVVLWCKSSPRQRGGAWTHTAIETEGHTVHVTWSPWWPLYVFPVLFPCRAWLRCSRQRGLPLPLWQSPFQQRGVVAAAAAGGGSASPRLSPLPSRSLQTRLSTPLHTHTHTAPPGTTVAPSVPPPRPPPPRAFRTEKSSCILRADGSRIALVIRARTADHDTAAAAAANP